MRRRSMAVVAAVSLLGGVAQVGATGHGGGFHGGFQGGFHGGFHGGFNAHGGDVHNGSHGGDGSHDGSRGEADGQGFRRPAPNGIGLNQGAITPAAIESGAFHAVARPEERNREQRFNPWARRDGRMFAGQAFRTGLRGAGAVFAPSVSRRYRPVYNYYYATGGSYYANPPSDYYTQAEPCADGRWNASSQPRNPASDCQG